MTCTRCDRPPMTGLAWCNGCRRRIEADLGDLPAHAADLEVTLARDTASRLGGRPGADKPLPYSTAAADALHRMRAFLVGWCRLLHEEQGVALPRDTIQSMGLHLLAWIGTLARHEAAAEFADELHDVVAAVVGAIDLPQDRTRVFVGPCPEDCEGEVWASFPRDEGKRPVMRCRACGAEWLPEQWSHAGERILRRMGRAMPLDPEAVRNFLRLVG